MCLRIGRCFFVVSMTENCNEATLNNANQLDVVNHSVKLSQILPRRERVQILAMLV
jgi:hypothetical protein